MTGEVGVEIAVVQQTAFRTMCHSEPVTDVTGVGISIVIVTASS